MPGLEIEVEADDGRGPVRVVSALDVVRRQLFAKLQTAIEERQFNDARELVDLCQLVRVF